MENEEGELVSIGGGLRRRSGGGAEFLGVEGVDGGEGLGVVAEKVVLTVEEEECVKVAEKITKKTTALESGRMNGEDFVIVGEEDDVRNEVCSLGIVRDKSFGLFLLIVIQILNDLAQRFQVPVRVSWPWNGWRLARAKRE